MAHSVGFPAVTSACSSTSRGMLFVSACSPDLYVGALAVVGLCIVLKARTNYSC